MPAGFPSSFASAAAGNNPESNSRRSSNRGDATAALGDWGRRPNGATQTFRRPSLATTNSHSAHHRETSASVLSPSISSGTYIPPQVTASRNGVSSDARYSRDHLLDLFRQFRDAGEFDDDPSDLYMGDFEHDLAPSSTGRWIRRDDSTLDPSTRPDVCLNHAADTEPLGLHQITAEERELLTSSVNSPLKAPNQGGAKDGPQREGAGPRKLSMSHSHGMSSVTSPTTARPMNRRRETSETFSRDTITSPTASRFGRDDADPALPPSLLRRKTESKDVGSHHFSEDSDADDIGQSSGAPVGLSRRVTTGPFSAGVNGPQSPWSQPATGGSFGSFSISNGSASYAKRPGGGLIRGESRFKGLMSKDSVENARSSIHERPSHGSLGKSSEHQETTEDEIDQLSADGRAVGSAALGGAHDERSSRQPGRSAQMQGYSESDSTHARLPAPNENQDYGVHMDGRGQPVHGADEPLSPTFTNPYQSPEQDMSRLNDMASDDIDFNNLHLPGLGGFQAEGMAAGPPGGRGMSAFDNRPFERQQSFGQAVSRGFPGLGGIGGLPAVSSPGGWGSPARERPFDGFGDLSFRQDGNAPASLGGLGFSAPRSMELPGSMMGSSRLGSLFPSAMQDQIRGTDGSRLRQQSGQEGDRPDESFEPFSARVQAQGFTPGPGPVRDADSPFGSNRNNDLTSTNESSPVPATQRLQPIGSQTNLAKLQAVDQPQQHLGGGGSISGQPPAAQQKTMVMPDRIRWIYRDPQGNTQGPWSGLEMHDWYRAGFFSPELLVKKVEDPDYEPLAQLIRRIGNSREPFLVPQIGIPGPPSSTTAGPWPPQTTPTQAPSGGAQPPFASSFPTFGTTLTAEQQNALERRKQEEQYLMARQKEHLAQQQVYHKMQMQSHPFHGTSQQQQQPLQHHSSAQSLQSQQSLSSMTSPPHGYQSNAQGSSQAPSGGFDGAFRQAAGTASMSGALDSLGHIEEEDQPHRHRDADEQSAPPRQELSHQYEQSAHFEHSIATALADRARLAREQAEFDRSEDVNLEQKYPGAERVGEFNKLREESSNNDNQDLYDLMGRYGAKQPAASSEQTGSKGGVGSRKKAELADEDLVVQAERNLTLTEQVQKAASAKKSPASGNQSPWAKVDKPIIDSHPASQTSSPLPAPAARRSGGQSVADALAADTASQRNSPVVDTPTTSIAPWARENTESQKQPSLKEIQEAEAKRAAKQEEVAAAMRRAVLEKELANHPPVPAPGLPSSSTWASGDAIMSPSATGASAWSKPSATKTIAPTSASAKKTLQQIQKEEEALAKRQRALAAAASANNASANAASSSNAQAVSAGKRYADLASRTTGPTSPASSAWTTVGAGGKAKGAPAAAGGPPAALNRTASGTVAAGSAGTARTKANATPARTVSGSAAPVLNAQEEFKKWAVGELRPDLKKGIHVEEFVSSLLNLPMDTDLITEAVHSASSTMDSRHFAEEFVKRRALADKGKSQPPSGSSALNQPSSEGKGSGWSEVASRKPAAATAKDDGASGFKIVPSKKKGGKR